MERMHFMVVSTVSSLSLALFFALCRRVWAAGIQDGAEERDREGWSHGSTEVWSAEGLGDCAVGEGWPAFRATQVSARLPTLHHDWWWEQRWEAERDGENKPWWLLNILRVENGCFMLQFCSCMVHSYMENYYIETKVLRSARTYN